MPDRLEIIVSLRDIASRGFSKISGAARRFGASVVSAAKTAGRGLLNLAKNIFFVGHAFRMLGNIARGVFDKFVGGARSIALLEVRFKHLTGSQKAAAAVMEEIRAVALATGKDIFDVGEAYALIAVNARDASGAFDPSKLTETADLLQFLSGLRPELPLTLIQRGINALLATGQVTSLEMIMDMPIRAMLEQAGILTDVASDIESTSREIGKAATFIEIGAAKGATKKLEITAQQVKEAVEAFTGISAAEMIEDIAEKSGMERLSVVAADLANVLGGPLFDALNEFAGTIADMYEQDPEKFRELAKALGDMAAAGLETLLDPLVEGLQSAEFIDAIEKVTEFLKLLQAGKVDAAFELIGLEDLSADLKGVTTSLSDIADALGIVADWILAIAGKREGGKDVGAVGVIEAVKGALGEAVSVVAPGGAGYEDVLKPFKGIADNLELIWERLSRPLGTDGAEPTKVIIEVTSDNAMFDARVRQGAEDVTVRAFDQVHRNYLNRER